jgi:hypothetical protein
MAGLINRRQAMGYWGLDSPFDSDMAAELTYDVVDVMVAALRKGLAAVDEFGVNTDGPTNVALFLEAFVVPVHGETVKESSALAALTRDTIVLLENKVAQANQVEWEDETDKEEHVIAYRRMIGRLREFLGHPD